MKKLFFPWSMVMLTSTILFSQNSTDTLKQIQLYQVEVTESRSTIARLPKTADGFIWSGKKNEVINLQASDANIAEKSPRQIFAKVPGVFVYDMDGTGNQVNISTRGLDPHRGWEFNIRKNGIITNTDLYGYPASHFTLPMEAVERIEMVRGTGALQYGQQFGGLINYVVKQPDTTRSIGLETVNSVGSFGMLSTYNAIGGKVGKLEYYAYYSRRGADGYREDSRSDFNGQSVMLRYRPSKNLSLTAEFSHSEYVIQLAGQLTDSMFQQTPRQSTRSRNYYSPDIYVPSISLDWALGENSRLKWTTSAVYGSRSSVLFDKPATTADVIDPTTLNYANRQVDIDNYHSHTSELRFLHNYHLGKIGGTVAAGVQYINNDLHRRQQGKGTTGTDFDLTVVDGKWGRDMHFKTQNIAFFVENLFQITDRFSVSPGVRLESGESKMSGYISYLPDDEVPNTIKHQFPLFGVNTEYKLGELQTLYAGWSQAYRPVIFKDIIPGSLLEKSDKNLKDAQGYNFEAGYRGAAGGFRWDIGVFRMQYNNRLGNQAVQEDSSFYVFRTNIGNSVTQGVELFAEYNFKMSGAWRASIFNSTAYMDAQYEDAAIRVGSDNVDISGNNVESVPAWISRSGFTLKYKTASLTALYSYTAESFADPLNTVKPSATGAVGVVPAYGLLDLNATWRITSNVTLRMSLNNVLDNQYFTKRPSFYPGPGIWPSDGRSGNVSVGVRF
ncbi:MAG: TonB-dependent receptor [Saprospiraceae bacterium]|nr:TonB-dependent receptor [Saprospiraceae bacterium]